MMIYQTTIRETPPIRVAALAHRGDYGQIGTTFEQLAAIAADMNLFGPLTHTFAIYYDDPSATPRDELRANACLAVALTATRDWPSGGPLEMREIRGGRYAVTLHVGPYAELPRAYQWLYGSWLPQTSEQPAAAPLVEAYLNDARKVPPEELQTEVWLPLR